MAARFSMREDLIAYALDELDKQDRRRVEELLHGDPMLREELDQVRQCLEDSSEEPCEQFGIPRGLADRTTAEIFAGRDEPRAAISTDQLGATRSFMSPIDMTVAIGILVTIGSLMFPALYSGRNQNQQMTCVNNLRQLGTVMTEYSDWNHRYYPVVQPYEHAGIFASRLRQADLLDASQLDQLMVCPSSPLASQLSNSSAAFQIPSLSDFSLANGQWLVELKRYSSGSYGYQPGHQRENFYFPSKNLNHSKLPILSDAPSRSHNFRATDNHGGKWVNVLFQDGSVHTLKKPMVPCGADHLFLNSQGLPSVGNEWNDAVLLGSEVTPGVEFPVGPMPQAVYRITVSFGQ